MRRVVAFALCLSGALALRVPAYGLPLDRDAAVYQVIGRALRGGEMPYVDLIDHKQPLVYPVYALIDLVAPGSAAAPRVVSALLSAVAAVLVFWLLREGARGATAAALVVVVGASRYVQGFDLNTEHLLLVTGTLPIVLAVKAPRAAFVIGMLCGLAILAKAVAILLLPAALIPLARSRWRRFAAGVAVPLLVVALLYIGHLDDLWEWNVAYNADYASVLSLGDRLERLRGQSASLLLIAASAAAAVICLRRRDPLALTLTVWLAGAVLGALAGGYAYAHYFVPIIVPAAALIALALPDRTAVPIAVAALGVLALLVTNRSLASRTYGGNAAVWEASEPVGAAIRERARPGDTMFVAGSEAGFYWQARVTPASRLLYDSVLEFRPELTPDLCAQPPRFLVLPAGTYPAYATCLQDAGYTPLERSVARRSPGPMKRVLILPKWYPWPDRPVFGLFTREQARAAALHNDVRVLAFRPEPMSGLAISRAWDDEGVTRLIYRRPRVRAAAMATQLIGMERAIRGMGWRPEIIHAHVFEAGFPAVLLARRFGARVVVSEHFTAFQRGLVQGMDLRIARFTFRHADLVCPVSEDLRAQLEAVEPRGRYRVVPNVVDTAIFHPGPRPSGRLRLLNVAALAEKKRHADLIDAVAGLDADLEIVGDGELRGELEARAGDNVRFLGALPPEAVAERMRAADVFVLSSEFENLPVVLLEALASGLPIVATDVGGVSEIVDESVGALVPPRDVPALRQAISDVTARSFDRDALAARARERYGMEALARTWDSIYAAL